MAGFLENRFRPPGLGFCLAHFALSFEGRALFHLETHGIHRTRDDRSRGEAARVEVAVSDDFALDDGFLCLQVATDRGVLTDRQTSFGGDVSLDGTVKNEVGGTIEVALDLDVAG